MRRHGQTSRERALFDLPLVVDPDIANEVDRKVKEGRTRESESAGEAEQIELPADSPTPGVEETPDAGLLSLIRQRVQAGLLDGAAAAIALGALLSGAARLGAPATAGHWPAYALVLVEFSFFYTVFSFAFWGRTPGMNRARLVVRSLDGGGLTLGRAIQRWAGSVATFVLLGLPTLLALREGRSLADYVSRTRTEPA